MMSLALSSSPLYASLINAEDVAVCQRLKSAVIARGKETLEPSKMAKVDATINSFLYLHNNARNFAKDDVATKERLLARFDMLVATHVSLPTPDCPEIEMMGGSEVIIFFQKINRYLFEEIDQMIGRAVEKALKINPRKDNFSFPPVEWAENVITGFDFFKLNQDDLSELTIQLREIIEKEYSPSLLEKFLSAGMQCLVVHEDKIRKGEPQSLKNFVDRARCTMCYPARVSALS